MLTYEVRFGIFSCLKAGNVGSLLSFFLGELVGVAKKQGRKGEKPGEFLVFSHYIWNRIIALEPVGQGLRVAPQRA